MKKLLVFCLFINIIFAKDTLTFPMYEQPKLYDHKYSYSFSEYREEDKYHYSHPSIPEPSTYALFVGLFGLAFAIYKKRKKQL